MNKLKNRDFSWLNWKLEKLVKERGLNIQKLADLSGVAVGTVQRLLTDPQCNPTLSSLESIAKVLRSSISYLIGEEEGTARQYIKIPIIDYENLLDEIEELTEVRKNKTGKKKFIIISLEEEIVGNINNYFCIQLKSSLPIRSIYPPGAYLIFNKDVSPYSHSHVLAYHNESQSILFKELIIDKPLYYLKSLNPLVDEMESFILTTNDRILATLIQVNLYDLQSEIQ